MQSEAEVTVRWFCENAMEANTSKFQGTIFKGNKQAKFTGLSQQKGNLLSFISSHLNYCPLVCFFTSRASTVKMQKIQERALRFVLKDSVSDYKSLLSKSDVDSFRISSMKNMDVEIYKILNKMAPGYLSSRFV